MSRYMLVLYCEIDDSTHRPIYFSNRHEAVRYAIETPPPAKGWRWGLIPAGEMEILDLSVMVPGGA